MVPPRELASMSGVSVLTTDNDCTSSAGRSIEGHGAALAFGRRQQGAVDGDAVSGQG